jgi:hypothetical protein
VNAFHVCGGLLAIWAVLTGILGITRENFPGSRGTERVVGAISVLLVAGTIFSALYTAAVEEEEHEEGERTGFVPPR